MTANSQSRKLLWQIAVPLLFFAAVVLVFPVWQSFQIDADEGVNLGKAMLVEQGYDLYDEIWSDQPPVLTYLLAGIIRVFGLSVPISRLLNVAFAALLLWAFFQILDTQFGKGHALAGTVILLLSNPFTRLSYAVLVGLPAISLALVSLYSLFQWHRKNQYPWLIFSALMLSLSVMTKMFSGILAPIMAIGLLLWEYNKEPSLSDWRKLIRPALIWSSSFFLLTAIIITAWVGVGNFSQLITPHSDASKLEVFQNHKLSVSPSLLILFAAGAFLAIKEKRWLMLYPITWTIAAYLFLSNHAPVWDHQSLLVTVPAILLASHAAHEALRPLAVSAQKSYVGSRFSMAGFAGLIALVALFSLLFEFRPPNYTKSFKAPSIPLDIEESFGKTQNWILGAINVHKSETQWLLTDLPMYGYRSGMPSPPNTAAITRKRYLTGNITDEDLIQTIIDYRPEQILLGRLAYPKVFDYLASDYYLTLFGGDGIRHYVLKDLVD